MVSKVSVIVPCYNAAKHIGETLLRIDNHLQTQAMNYEIIAVNDGSLDNTQPIIEDYIRYLKNPPPIIILLNQE